VHDPAKPQTIEEAIRKAAAGGCRALIAAFRAKATAQLEKMKAGITAAGFAITWDERATGKGDDRCIEYGVYSDGSQVGYAKMCCGRDPAMRFEWGSGPVRKGWSPWPEAGAPEDWTRLAKALMQTLENT